jgi:MFS family permease
LAARSYLRDCFTKPYYYWVFACFIVPNLAFMPENTFNLYFSASVGMSIDLFGKLNALYFAISLLLTIPLGWLVDKFGGLRVALVGLIFHSAASLYGGLFIHDSLTFGIAFVLTGVLSGTWYTATASLAAMLLPKLKFAQYASALWMVSALCSMSFGPAMGKFLDYSHHQYRYTYLSGFILDIAGLLVTLVVFRKYQALGGAKNYVAPE